MMQHAKLSQRARLNLVEMDLGHSKIYGWDKTATFMIEAMLHIIKF